MSSLMQWLAETEWSIALHESQYGYAVVESVHVWSLCLFVGFAVLLDLRLLGIVFRDVPVMHMIRRVLPWTKIGFAVMVVSGVLLVYAIPFRTYHNVFFRVKAVLLVLAGLNVFVFHTWTFRSVEAWDTLVPTQRAARLAAVSSLVLWTAIVFAGRMIAYNWFDCGKRQSAFIAAVAGCTPDMVDPYSQ